MSNKGRQYTVAFKGILKKTTGKVKQTLPQTFAICILSAWSIFFK
jgi:hypothetical protein